MKQLKIFFILPQLGGNARQGPIAAVFESLLLRREKMLCVKNKNHGRRLRWRSLLCDESRRATRVKPFGPATEERTALTKDLFL
jgi:hypothetical protein